MHVFVLPLASHPFAYAYVQFVSYFASTYMYIHLGMHDACTVKHANLFLSQQLSYTHAFCIHAHTIAWTSDSRNAYSHLLAPRRVTVLGPSTIGSCDTADIIVQGASPRPMHYSWSCINSEDVADVVSGTFTERLLLSVCRDWAPPICSCVHVFLHVCICCLCVCTSYCYLGTK